MVLFSCICIYGYYEVGICLVSFASSLAVVILYPHHRDVLHMREFQPWTYLSHRGERKCFFHCKPDVILPAVTQIQISPELLSGRIDSINSSPEGEIEAQRSRVLCPVYSTIDRNERRLREQERRERTELELKQVTLVSDRAPLCKFFLTTIISTTVILYGSPPG